MKKSALLKPVFYSSMSLQSVKLIVALSSVLLSGSILAQELSVRLDEQSASALEQTPSENVTAKTNFGAYDQGRIDLLGLLGHQNQESGKHEQALLSFKQALHITRINNGLYHESQIPIVDNIIAIEIALENWEEVNNYYAYQEHLYRRLYAMDDPRLEAGLQKVSNWHINALNAEIGDRRIVHLRKANQLSKLRMEIAMNTLSFDDPKLNTLAENIRLFERELFLVSNLDMEMELRQ